jgi:hypothetical protein
LRAGFQNPDGLIESRVRGTLDPIQLPGNGIPNVTSDRIEADCLATFTDQVCKAIRPEPFLAPDEIRREKHGRWNLIFFEERKDIYVKITPSIIKS